MPTNPQQKIPILMVSHYYPPVGGVRVLRTVKIAKYLSRMGFLPVVLSAKEEILQTASEEELDNFHRLLIRLPIVRLPSRQTKKIPKAGVERGGYPKRMSSLKQMVILILRAIKQFILYPDITVAWIPSAYRAGLCAIRKYGVRAIYASHPPPSNLIVALLLALRTRRPLIVDFRDLWRYYPFRVKFHPLELLLTPWLEKYLIKKSALVVTVTPSLVRSFLKDHRPYLPPKLLYLPNGYDEEDFSKAKPAAKDSAGRFRLVHTGTLYPGRGAEYFFSALSQALREQPALANKLVFRQVGYVDITVERELSKLVAQGIAQQIPPVSHSEAISELLSADLLVIINPPGKAGESVLALKSTEYLRAGKPILVVSSPSPTSRLVERLGAGRTCGHRDTSGIAQAILDFFERRTGKWVGDDRLLGWYERGFQVQRLVKALQGILAAECRGAMKD
jgi:glycosyltransferase involved in cell wall biosynthesis